MSKIRIKNFGPIKEGCIENDGWIDVKKVTIFIGNQGSGKSSVAKLISTFMWLEKSLIRGDITTPISNNDVIDLLAFHRLENYLEANTEIEFEGATYSIKLVGNVHTSKQTIDAKIISNKSVKQPKIMYVPAERNFLSSIKNINKVSNFIVGSLQNYSIEFRNAQLAYKDKSIDLPINNTKIFYDPTTDQNYIEFDKKQLQLSNASSGFHSIVPLYLVTKYLSDFLKKDEKELLDLLSTDQIIRRNIELRDLQSSERNTKTLQQDVQKINEKYVCKHFINIVEEPEQNLFPSSQRGMLNSLLSFNNINTDNKLVITTHSPYLINYLTHTVKASMILEKIDASSKKIELRKKLEEIVPINAAVRVNDWVVYELNEIDGSIIKLPNYNGLPSDENYLNNSLGQSNDIFINLLEFEDLCQ